MAKSYPYAQHYLISTYTDIVYKYSGRTIIEPKKLFIEEYSIDSFFKN